MHADPLSAQLTNYLPSWIAWYGRRTGSYWAVPNWPGAPNEMIEAPDVATLDERMTEVEATWARRHRQRDV